MVHLRTFAMGPNGPMSPNASDAVAAAAITRLYAAKKEAYDRSLQARMPRRAAALPVATVLPASEPLDPPSTQAPARAFDIPHVEVPVVTAAASRHAMTRQRPLWQH